MFNCEILADSLNPQGDRLTTMKITFPRFILAEFNTHRMFSRNSASSRAIPFNKMVKMVEENPFIPIAWQKDHKGMQGTEYINDENDFGATKCCEEDWLTAKNEVIAMAKSLNKLGVTKQLCNRLLEPFMWHTVIVTASEWENFFKLRCPQYIDPSGVSHKSKKDYRKNSEWSGWEGNENDVLGWLEINKSQAEIHIQAIAEMMWDAYNESTPKQLKAEEWHIPFGDNIDLEEWYNSNKRPNSPYYSELEPDEINKYLIKIATARCARISYETLGDNPKIDYEADIRLHDMLLESGHMSPFEHCAKAMSDEEYTTYNRYDNGASIDGWCRNFKGFIQYRHLVEK